MKEDELLKGSIHVVRKIGNDYSHWKKEYDLPFATLKAYVEIVIQAFQNKIYDEVSSDLIPKRFSISERRSSCSITFLKSSSTE